MENKTTKGEHRVVCLSPRIWDKEDFIGEVRRLRDLIIWLLQCVDKKDDDVVSLRDVGDALRTLQMFEEYAEERLVEYSES